MRKLAVYVSLAVAAAVAAVLVVRLRRGDTVEVKDYARTERPARISPDYAGCVIPPNVAPLNFVVREPAKTYLVRIAAEGGERIDVVSRSGRIIIPTGPWKGLLRANRGGQLTVEVFTRADDGTWRRFEPVVNTVANEEIDGYLVYRLMRPLYNLWRSIAIHQRNLGNYDERVILHNRSFGGGCVNCHTFLRNRPVRMAINIRGRSGTAAPGGLLLSRNDSVEKIVNTKTAFNPIPAIYLAWHPSGKALAFSTNKIVQAFHSTGENRHVFDYRSDLALYFPRTNTVTTTPEIAIPNRLETYPTWSPDGKHLYFCRGPQLPIKRYRRMRYDLMRISYDIDTGTWGKCETVLSAAETKRSITHPRISPDGRFLLFCMCDHGNFSIYQPSSDLHLMDMTTGKHRRLAINSDLCESWHTWSSNGRWVVFSSKRRDGVLAKPYFSYVDAQGKFHKPFVLPQKDPTFYDGFLKTYNVPELIRDPLQLTERTIARALYAPEMTVKAQLDPNVKALKPTGPGAEDTRYEPGPGG